jgi:dolichyl-phosphate-mannose-protein mannosyltransferase
VALASGVLGALEVRSEHFAIGGGLMVLSALVLRWPRSIWQVRPSSDLSRRQRRLVLLAVCAVAVFFRTYHLNLPGIWGDDAINGMLAFQVLDGQITSPFQLVVHSMSVFHAFTNYVIAATFWAFGAGPETLRLPGIILGTLAVPLLYGIVAPLFGVRVGLVTALFFACAPMQVSHSKILLQVMLGEFLLLLGLYPLVRGFTGQRRWLIVVAAVPIAAALYTYHSAKLVPAIALVVVLALCVQRAELGWRRLAPAVAGFMVTTVLCAIPAVWTYATHPGALTGRISGVALWQPAQPLAVSRAALGPLWDSVWRTLLIFHYQQGPVYQWFGIGSDPAFNPVVAFLLVHGLIQALRHVTQPRHWALFGWIAIGLLPGFLSIEAPRAYRILLATPPLFVFAALPVVQLYECARQAASLRRWLQGIVALLVLAVPVVDFNYYFYRVYTNHEFRWYQAARMVDMAESLRKLGPGWTGYVLSDSFAAGYETLAFLSRAWGLTIRGLTSFADRLPVRASDGGVLFMLDRDNISVGAALRTFYPSVALELHTDPPQRSWWFDRWLPLVPQTAVAPPTGAFFPVSRQVADAARGITVTFLSADGTPIASRIDPQVQVQEPRDLPHGAVPVTRAQWLGALDVPTEGTYKFTLQSGAAARVWIDGEPIVAHESAEGTAALAQGLHRITAEATVGDLPVLRLQWQPPGESMHDIPASALFRNADVHGLLAEYQFVGRTLHRIEPYPYYWFYPPPFDETFSVQWRGTLRVPAPGGFQLEVLANPPSGLVIDGGAWSREQPLAVGAHRLEIVTRNAHTMHLQLLWIRPGGIRELILPDAFSPPSAG